MNSKSLIIVVDADAIIAQAQHKDANFNKAVKIAKYLLETKSTLIYPVTAIAEAITVLQRKLNNLKDAYATAVDFTNPQIRIVGINNHIFNESVNNYFNPVTSKKNTIFDCIVCTIAKKYNADAIFSFDRFYKTKGFKLASDLK